MTFWQNQDLHGFSVSRYAAPGSGSGAFSLKPPNEVQGAAESSSGAYPGRTHAHHPNCPNSLNCLPDTDEKPPHILPVIVRSAILGSPKKKLTLREIYAAIEEKWPYYRTAQSGWKDSIRHNLSLNRLFVKVPRPGTEPGYGSYWTVDLDAPPGSKRPRKRGTPMRFTSGSDVTEYPGDPSSSRDLGAMIMPPFRLMTEEPNPIRSRSSHNSGSELEPDEDKAEDPPSDYETDEGASPAPELPGGFGPPSLLLHPKPNEPPDEKIARLQAQLSESQRQFSVASAFSLRLSEQLEEAKEEASQAQVKLRAAREQLEEEQVARVEVEKRLEEEEELHRQAEEQLKTLLQKGGPDVKLFEAIRSIQDISKRALGR